jgi:hypothetical protein
MTSDDVAPGNVKHMSAHVAIEAQPSIALSQGFTLWGQQSMSSIAAMFAASVDFMTAPVLPAAGSTTTDTAIRSANMTRAIFMAAGK